MKIWIRLAKNQRGPLALAGWIAIAALPVSLAERIDAAEIAQATSEKPATNTYEQQVSKEAAGFRPTGTNEKGEKEGEPRQSTEPASAPSGIEPGRVDRIKAFVDEALSAPEEDPESAPTSGAETPQPALDPVNARRKELKALVTEPTELSNAQDARYLNELRDEVSDTMVFGEARPTQLVGPAVEAAAAAETAPGSYQVKPGDSLWKIAQDRYGDGFKWRRIYEANRDSLQNMNVLREGQVLSLPSP